MNFGSGDFSISFWVNFYEFRNYNRILAKYQSGNGWIAYSNDGRLDVNICGVNNIDAGEHQLNTWEFYSISKSSGRIKTYKNGILISDIVTTTQNPDTNVDLVFGKYGSYLKGKLDEIRIYNRALTSNEVVELYDGTPASDDLCNSLFCDGENVGIGTTDTKGYKLAVAGKTITEEVKVALIENWPDYVLEEQFELPTLEEVEQHIVENGHLPEIPSEAEVTQNGINLGEMDAKLLQKIEELTLYMIDINKRVSQLEQENSELKESNQELKEKISTLKNN